MAPASCLPQNPAVLFLAPPASAEVALEAAAACFEAVDYDCAAEKLLIVWGIGGLDAPAEVRARLLEAQIALAQREEPRARKALRALLVAAPEYTPDARLPPRLRAMIEEERPPPPPFFSPTVRAGLTSWRLFGNDGDRWSDGLGTEIAAGGVFLERWGVEAGFAYSDHRPRTYDLNGLTLLNGYVGANAHIPAGFLVFSPGLTLGAMHVNAEGVTGTDAYWGFQAQVPIDVSAEIWGGIGIGGRVGVMLVAVSDGQDRAAFSWVLPLEIGLRYAF